MRALDFVHADGCGENRESEDFVDVHSDRLDHSFHHQASVVDRGGEGVRSVLHEVQERVAQYTQLLLNNNSRDCSGCSGCSNCNNSRDKSSKHDSSESRGNCNKSSRRNNGEGRSKW